MDNTVIDNAATPSASTHKILQIVYIIYLLSLLFPFLAIVGVVFTYVFRNDAAGYLESHAQYLIRSFWIGLLYFIIAGLLCFILIGFILLFVLGVWWIIRMASGLRALLSKKPIQRPLTWWLI
jgi:uncharacterized membrane protein